MFQQRRSLPSASFTCPSCHSTRFRVSYNKVECINCGHCETGRTANKYGAKRTESKDGIKRDSKFEAGYADEFLLRKQLGDIKDYDSQYKIEASAYRADGSLAFTVKHKVDFRLHNNDGSFTLVECKGVETDDYKWRRKCLEALWLPLHPDHDYVVLKQGH